jgi:hypothetical protein
MIGSRPSSPRARGAAARTFVCAGLLLLPGCLVADAKVWNLRQVHDEEGDPKRIGDVRSDIEYALFNRPANVRGTGLLEFLNRLDEPRPRRIADPLRVALINSIELGQCDENDARIAGLQVEIFAWLGSEASWVLTRERAVLELGRAARRLELRAPIAPPSEGSAAGPEAVARAARALWASRGSPVPVELLEAEAAAQTAAAAQAASASDASAAELSAQQHAPPEQREPALELDAACAALEALPTESAGARRALAAVNTYVLHAQARGGIPPRVLELSRNMQVRACGLVLESARHDRAPRVRAAALEAHLGASGAAHGELLADALRDEGREVRLAALRWIARFGLGSARGEARPAHAPAPELDAWVDPLLELATGRDSAIGVAACRALGVLSGGELASLRYEDWLAWRAARSAAPVGPLPAPAPTDLEPAAPAESS